MQFHVSFDLLGYDSFMSDVLFCRQEYILLNCHYVLPEFLMHVSFKIGEEKGNLSLSERVQRSVVAVPNHCARRDDAPKPRDSLLRRQQKQVSSPLYGGSTLNVSPSKVDALTRQLNTAFGFDGSDPGGNASQESLLSRQTERASLQSCADVFAANAFFAAASLRKANRVRTAMNNFAVGETDDKSLTCNEDIEALAKALAEFDSRGALQSKQIIVRSIENIVQSYSSARIQLIAEVMRPKS
jgi:hypothetical protein